MKKLHMSSADGCGRPSTKFEAAMNTTKMWLVLVMISVWMKSLMNSSRSGSIGAYGVLTGMGRGSGGDEGFPGVELVGKCETAGCSCW